MVKISCSLHVRNDKIMKLYGSWAYCSRRVFDHVLAMFQTIHAFHVLSACTSRILEKAIGTQ